MPTEPVAALVYICLLLPGVAFVWSYEGHRSLVKRSAFRETAAVVIASVASIAVVFLAHYLMAFFSESAQADLHTFLLDPGELFRDDSQRFLGIVFLDLLGAILVGLFLGSRNADMLRRKIQDQWRKLRKSDVTGMDREQSGWLAAFGAGHPGDRVHVGIQLKSGAWVQGILYSFTKTGDEVPERALTLSGSVYYRVAGGDNLHPLEEFSLAVVQASEIDYLMVGYEPAAGDISGNITAGPGPSLSNMSP